jgi:hypothetical protein
MYLPTSPHGVTTQKNIIIIFTIVVTSNLILITLWNIGSVLKTQENFLFFCHAWIRLKSLHSFPAVSIPLVHN